MENPQYNQEDELDLREYINVIIKRKKLILGVFIFSVIVSVIMGLLLPKTYKITSLLQLGNVRGLLINKVEAKEIILNRDNLLSVVKELGLNEGPEKLGERIKLSDISEANLLSIEMLSSDIDIDLRIHNLIIGPFLKQGSDLYKEQIALIQNRLKELDEEISNSLADISRTQALISSLSVGRGVSQQDISLRIILFQNSLPAYRMNLQSLRNERSELQQVIMNAKEFKVFSHPFKLESPVAPKKKQMFILSGFIGLFLGVFLVFIMESIVRSKK